MVLAHGIGDPGGGQTERNPERGIETCCAATGTITSRCGQTERNPERGIETELVRRAGITLNARPSGIPREGLKLPSPPSARRGITSQTERNPERGIETPRPEQSLPPGLGQTERNPERGIETLSWAARQTPCHGQTERNPERGIETWRFALAKFVEQARPSGIPREGLKPQFSADGAINILGQTERNPERGIETFQ